MTPRLASVGITLAVTVAACGSGPPVKTASGEHIKAVSYEERDTATNETEEGKFSGGRLQRAVAMMERHGVVPMSGYFGPSINTPDKSLLQFSVTTVENGVRKIILKNCAEPHLCGFFAEATRDGLIDKAPTVCRDAIPCENLNL